MAIRALNLAETRDYVSVLDDHHPDKHGSDPAKATRFKLRTLDSRVYGHLRDMATEIGQSPDGSAFQRVNANKMYFEACRFGLAGWSGLKDYAGHEVPFKTEETTLGGRVYTVATNEVLRLLPGDVVTELAVQIRRGNELTEEEAKNSETPS